MSLIVDRTIVGAELALSCMLDVQARRLRDSVDRRDSGLALIDFGNPLI